jgi:DNA-binding NarL/FixJ family response regulator
MAAKIPVLIASGDVLTREGLKVLLREQGEFYVVSEATSGGEAIRQARLHLPELVILDEVLVPRSEGDLTRMIQVVCPTVRVLLLTAESRPDSAGDGQAGAVWSVARTTNRDTILQAIRQAARSGSEGSPRSDSPVHGRQSSIASVRAIDLSDREEAVLRYMALGLSNKEIAARLEVSVKTIETYKTRFQKKLKLSSRVDIVRYAAQQGWLMKDALPL